MPNPATESSSPSNGITIGGAVYQLRRLGHEDLLEFGEWVRQRFIEAGRKAAAELPHGLERAKALQRLFDVALDVQFFTRPEALALLTSPAGVARFVWLSLRRGHRTLSESDVAEWLQDPAIVANCLDKLDALNGLSFAGLKALSERSK